MNDSPLPSYFPMHTVVSHTMSLHLEPRSLCLEKVASEAVMEWEPSFIWQVDLGFMSVWKRWLHMAVSEWGPRSTHQVDLGFKSGLEPRSIHLVELGSGVKVVLVPLPNANISSTPVSSPHRITLLVPCCVIASDWFTPH